MMDGTREKQEKMGVEIMQNLSCHSIAEMRRLDWQILRDENDRLGFFNGFGMYADGYVLPEDIDKMVVKGDIRNADIIIGCTVDEGANDRKPPFGSNTCAQARAFGKVIHKLGHKAVYEYVFDRPQPGDDAGTPHSCDNRYQFGTLDGSWRPYTEEDWILSEVMQKYWANFAATGNPNGDGLSSWLPYDENELSMKLAAEGCEMVDYNDLSSGKLKKLEDEIIENIKKQIQ